MVKRFLQGQWLGHPLHPALVHLPVGLWVSALVFDLFSQIGRGNNAFVQISFYAIGLGILVALLAILTGLAEWWDDKSNPAVWRLGLWHLSLNGLATVLWIINLGLRVGT